MKSLDQYRGYQMDTAGPEERVALLYDGARRFVDFATVALDKERYEQVSLNVGKAQRILTELAASLDMSQGELPANLFRLYEYWQWRLSQGVLKKDMEALREVSAVLMDMHEAWAEAARQVRAQRPARALS